VAGAEDCKTLELGAAESVKRVKLHRTEVPVDWYAEKAQSLYAIRDFVEFKTTWHPIGA
jgi:aldehyde dehydrogenase (NAD+)